MLGNNFWMTSPPPHFVVCLFSEEISQSPFFGKWPQENASWTGGMECRRSVICWKLHPGRGCARGLLHRAEGRWLCWATWILQRPELQEPWKLQFPSRDQLAPRGIVWEIHSCLCYYRWMMYKGLQSPLLLHVWVCMFSWVNECHSLLHISSAFPFPGGRPRVNSLCLDYECKVKKKKITWPGLSGSYGSEKCIPNRSTGQGFGLQFCDGWWWWYDHLICHGHFHQHSHIQGILWTRHDMGMGFHGAIWAWLTHPLRSQPL